MKQPLKVLSHHCIVRLQIYIPLLLLTFCVWFQVEACLIACVKTDNRMLVANHEDWFARDAAIKITSPTRGIYGSVTFTFKSEGWSQGGMNEHGLFFDAAYTPYQDIDFDPGLKKPSGYIWHEVLAKCKNVKEALDFLSVFRLEELNEAHIVLADSSGHAVTIGVNQGKVVYRSMENDKLIQTNFNPWQPELSDEESCPRFTTATNLLESKPADESTLLQLLKLTEQDSLTVYSNIYDLTNKKIITYSERKYDKPIEISMDDAFNLGNCIIGFDHIEVNDFKLDKCDSGSEFLIIKGDVIDAETIKPIPYVNIGIVEDGIGTLSDEQGAFEFELSSDYIDKQLKFSSVGYESMEISVGRSNQRILLKPKSLRLEEVTIEDKKRFKIERLGYMKGRDGIVPLGITEGGGVAALLIEAPKAPFLLTKLQFRLLYNSKDTLAFRLRVFDYDELNDTPGKELLSQNIILMEQKRFGWVRFDLHQYNIEIKAKKVFIGLEWLTGIEERKQLVAGIADWERWKNIQFNLNNPKVKIISEEVGKRRLKYYGDMRDWPGFNELPPWTGLMVETGKNERTQELRTFERKQSFGKWEEIQSTLNLVAVIAY